MVLAVERLPILSPIETDTLSIADVSDQINGRLRGTELEPEYLEPANGLNNPNEAYLGPMSTRAWPTVGTRERLAVSVHRGWSEGWHVYVDWIHHVGEVRNFTTCVQKLLRAKTLSSNQAWELARAITKILDIA